MKLHSQETKRFDARELRKLAKETRPKREWGPREFAAAGAALGLTIVAAARFLLG